MYGYSDCGHAIFISLERIPGRRCSYSGGAPMHLSHCPANKPDVEHYEAFNHAMACVLDCRR